MTECVMANGMVKTYNAARGFGFIKPDGPREDIFFHLCEYPLGKPPAVGARVIYDLAPDGSGRTQAVNVQLRQ
jgi:CspA family cold shock protein